MTASGGTHDESGTGTGENQLARDAAAPDAVARDTVAPDAVAPDAAAPDAVARNAVARNAVAPDTVAPDPAARDTAARVAERSSGLAVLIAARNEADTIGGAIASLKETFPGATIWVADDASEDGTNDIAMVAGARVIRRGRVHGKGGNMTACAEAMLSDPHLPSTVLLCDADLALSAGQLGKLVDAVEQDECDLAVAAFARRVGGGFGVALGFSRWVIEKRCGFLADAPISGQRAMKLEVLQAVLPFAPAYGMETGMTIDAVRAGYRIGEYELQLAHRATGKTLRGFIHRFRQMIDFARVYVSRRKDAEKR